MKKHITKTTFWVLIAGWIVSTTLLSYQIFDKESKITFLKEQKEDTEFDLEQLSEIIKGKITKTDFQDTLRYPNGIENKIEFNQLKIIFDSTSNLIKVTSKW
jgi:hypothetical protein